MLAMVADLYMPTWAGIWLSVFGFVPLGWTGKVSLSCAIHRWILECLESSAANSSQICSDTKLS